LVLGELLPGRLRRPGRLAGKHQWISSAALGRRTGGSSLMASTISSSRSDRERFWLFAIAVSRRVRRREIRVERRSQLSPTQDVLRSNANCPPEQQNNGCFRRLSPLAARRGEGPFAEPTTAIRRKQRDRRNHPSSRPVFIERERPMQRRW
jgi:hypothetical protein